MVQSNAPALTAGVDVGDKYCVVCVLDSDGEVVEESRVPTTKKAVATAFQKREPLRVALEAGTHSAWISDSLKASGHDVIVANPRSIALITQSDRKNDENDAQLLARLARADPKLLSPIEHRAPELRVDLAVIRGRDGLVRSRTALVNAVRGILKSSAVKLPKCSSESFHKRVPEHVPPELWPAVEGLLKVVAEQTKQIRALDKRITDLTEKKYPESALPQQISGVGELTALAFMLTLGDKNRFAKSRDVGVFFGLVPKQQASSSIDPQLRITKAGNALVRKLLVGSAHYVLGRFGPDTDLRRWGLELASKGGKNGKKRAVVAVARKLAVLMHRLWVTGEVYEPLRQATKRSQSTTKENPPSAERVSGEAPRKAKHRDKGS